VSWLLGAGGRLRAGWRLLLFALLVVGGDLLFGEVVAEIVPGARSGRGLVPWVGVSVSLVVVLGATFLVARRVEGVPLAALGLPAGSGALREAAGGVLVGAALMGGVVGLLALTGAVTWRPQVGGPGAGAVAGATLFLAVGALEEELLFRGYPLQVLAESVGGRAAVVITAVGFACLHLFNPGLGRLALLNIVLAGILLGTAYWRTYSLWFVSGLHLAWNWCMGVGADLPVSGITARVPGFRFLDTPGYDAATHGATWWSGGAFGPEAGLAVTLVAVAGTWWLARTGRLCRSERVRRAGPLPSRRSQARAGGSPRTSRIEP